MDDNFSTTFGLSCYFQRRGVSNPYLGIFQVLAHWDPSLVYPILKFPGLKHSAVCIGKKKVMAMMMISHKILLT